MISRQPYLPRFVAGGPSNPLGARAMYLSGSVYRIHGTNAPSTIGGQVSSGCIRMVNEDVIDLYNRVKVGSKVVVLPMIERHAAAHTVESLPGGRRVPTSLGGIY
jgi:lipoprotein-anchoring transpeptidase ErfK/SrfK